MNTPFDVVKSRMQYDNMGKNCFEWLVHISKTEGYQALYKGIGARLLRLGPGGGIMIVAYDQMMQLLK